MKPLLHAQASVSRYGGLIDNYLPIHEFMDSSKAMVADVRHRAVFHSAFGIFIVEKVFGSYITNWDGKKVSVRDIAEDHVKEDLGFIPSLETWVRNMRIEDWMMGKGTRGEAKHIAMEDTVQIANCNIDSTTAFEAYKKGLYYD